MVNMAANFDHDLLKTTEDIFPQSRRILQTFVWWGVGKFVSPPLPFLTTQTSVKFRDFVEQLYSFAFNV